MNASKELFIMLLHNMYPFIFENFWFQPRKIVNTNLVFLSRNCHQNILSLQNFHLNKASTPNQLIDYKIKRHIDQHTDSQKTITEQTPFEQVLSSLCQSIQSSWQQLTNKLQWCHYIIGNAQSQRCTESNQNQSEQRWSQRGQLF